MKNTAHNFTMTFQRPNTTHVAAFRLKQSFHLEGTIKLLI